MEDFFNAAFPWVAMGLAVAIILTRMKKQDDKEQ